MMDVQVLELNHFDQINELVSLCFRYSAPHTFFDDFPIWASLQQVVRFGIFDDDKLVSHVGVRYAIMFGSKEPEVVAMIGAVATHPDYRGKGLSTKLLKHALKTIDETGARWTLLWGSEHEFYGKLGFELRGVQTRVVLSEEDLTSLPEAKINETTNVSNKILTVLLASSNKKGIRLTSMDSPWIKSHKTIRWFECESPWAYVAFERGLDLHHIVHEMGGDPIGIKCILKKILEKDPEAQMIATRSDLGPLQLQDSVMIDEFLCLARPKDSTQKWDDDFWVSGLGAC